MRFGAITNSWGVQIAGDNLPDLVSDARGRGAEHIELRQTFLADCERGEDAGWRPVIANLKALAEGFPDLSFNLAMSMPFLSAGVDAEGDPFQQAIEGALVVGRDSPHLRLVDPTPQDHVWERADQIPDPAMSLADLAGEATSRGVTLSVENSGQSIGALALLVKRCREKLSNADAKLLGLCPDPANQLRRQPGTDALADLGAVPLDMLKIVHIKQARGGTPIPTVDDGDLDCARMTRILESKRYAGPTIFEIPSHEDAFDNLSSSFAYVEKLLQRS